MNMKCLGLYSLGSEWHRKVLQVVEIGENFGQNKTRLQPVKVERVLAPNLIPEERKIAVENGKKRL